jgi:spermidine synthase
VVSAGDTHHFFAGRRPGLVTDDPDRLGRRYRERGFSSEYMTPRSFYRFFPPSAMDYLEAKLKAPEEVRLNTDDRPVSYYLRLMWWEQMTGDPASRAVIQALFRVGDWGPWALAVFAIGWIWLFVRARPGPTAVWTMFLTGGAAMSLQLTLIFLYQNKYGILYQQIGLISAVFMAGLAVGGRLVARRSSSDTPFRWAPISETLLIAAALLTWAAVVYDWSWLILPLVGLTGLGGGLGFASLFALYLQDPADPSARSALAGLEAADHGGAAAGALIAGLSLAPVIGLGPTAALLAGMKLVGLAAVGRTVFKLVRPAG